MPDVSVDYGRIQRMVQDVGRELSSQLGDVRSDVGAVRTDLASTASELAELRARFDEYVEQAARVANVQQSETRVVNLKAQLDREYGHYNVVRRTSIGMLQAFDIGNVTNASVQSISEELMIQTPRYWLAPTLVALAAWSRDDKDLAEKSVDVAFSRDPQKTSLFFTLMMRRNGRLDAAVRWLRHYLKSLDPTALSREFAVILEASSYNAFGPVGQKLVADTMSEWVTRLRDDDAIVEKQIQRWIREIGLRRMELDVKPYETLAALSPDFPAVKRQLELASALGETVEHFGAIAARESLIPVDLVDTLDDILESLVTNYDSEELPLRRDVLFHETVIAENGDLARARQTADTLAESLEDATDVVTLQTQAAVMPEQLGVSEQTQRLMIGVGVSDFRTATGRFTANYRKNALTDAALDFGATHSQYATTYSFKGCQLRTSTPEDQGIETLRATWDDTFKAYIDALRFDNKWYIKPTLVGIGVCLVLFMIKPIAGFLGLLVAAGVVWYLGDQKAKKAAAAIKQAEDARQAALETSVSLYRDATAQFVDALLVYEECDAHEADLLRVIDTWPTRVHDSKEQIA